MYAFDAAALAREYADAYYASDDDPRMAAWADAHVAVWDALVDRALRLQPRATALLDIGAGSGGFLARVRARRPDLRLAAVESSAAARSGLAARVPGVEFLADDVRALSDVDVPARARFDVITVLQTLEHVADPLHACRAARAHLRHGGSLLVAVPNRSGLQALCLGDRAPCFANGTHLQFFSRRSLTRILRAAGFVRVRRLIEFGGGQRTGLPARVAQYALRAAGLAGELRFAATRTA